MENCLYTLAVMARRSKLKLPPVDTGGEPLNERIARLRGLGQRRIEGLKRGGPPRGKQPEVYASLLPPSYRNDNIADCWRKIAWLLKKPRFEKLGEIWGIENV